MKGTTSAIWGFDFDGTLSPLVPDRSAARLDPECRRLLMALAADPRQAVAIISSRTLDDLAARVQIPELLLAGSSGLEWRIPGGHRLRPNQRVEERLHRQRQLIVPDLRSVENIPGVELEDKSWSASIHFRSVTADDRVGLARSIEDLVSKHGISVHYGPEVAELQFLPDMSKEMAIQTLAQLFKGENGGRSLVYAGDDQNDACAMRWVLQRKGTAYIVGNRVSVPGAIRVEDPPGLARALRKCLGERE
ncbi:MAG: trehalose-phosphatase [Candidatus Zixiibacteriota bacterium]